MERITGGCKRCYMTMLSLSTSCKVMRSNNVNKVGGLTAREDVNNEEHGFQSTGSSPEE